jgi:hypothetical protein
MWNWIKIPKGIALAAFFLPWITVSCANQPLMKATGFGLAFGQITAIGPAATGDKANVNFWLILAIAAIIGGLFIAFGKGRSAAFLSLCTSAASFALILIATSGYSKSAILAKAAERKGGGDSGGMGGEFASKMDQAMANGILVEWHFGYWLALMALAVAVVMAWLVWKNRDDEAEAMIRAKIAEAKAAASSVSAPPPTDPPPSA